jgi:hypothetical protein
MSTATSITRRHQIQFRARRSSLLDLSSLPTTSTFDWQCLSLLLKNFESRRTRFWLPGCQRMNSRTCFRYTVSPFIRRLDLPLSVLLFRLSEKEKLTVAVLEAGTYHGDGVPWLEVSGTYLCSFTRWNVIWCIGIGLMGQSLSNTTYDWSFRTVPQAFANGREIPQPRGKGLGGSSLVQWQFYIAHMHLTN